MKNLVWIILIVFFSASLYSQEINQKDEKGQKQGHWKLYEHINVGMANEDSVLVSEGSYKNNRKNGVWSLYENGTLKIKQSYKFERKLGTCQQFYPSGKMKEQGEFVRGKYRGADQKFFSSGCMEYVCFRDSLAKPMIELHFNDDCAGTGRGSIKDSISHIPAEDTRKFKDESLFSIGTTNTGVLVKGKYESLANKSDSLDCKYEKELQELVDYTGQKELKNHQGNILFNGLVKKGIFWTGIMYCYDSKGNRIKTKTYKDKKIMKVTRP